MPINTLLFAVHLTVALQSSDLPTEATLDHVVTEGQTALAEAFAAGLDQPEAIFADSIDTALSSQLSALDAVAGPDGAVRARARLRYEWARARFAYAARRNEQAGQADYHPSEAYMAFTDRLDADRADWLDLPSYSNAILAWRDHLAETLRHRDPNFAYGDNLRLDSQLAASAHFENEVIRCFLDGRALSSQVEDFAADGIGSEPEAYAERCPGELADTLLAEFNAARAEREGHRIETYRETRSGPLEIHVYGTDEVGSAPRPGVVWLHGGGWYTGSWSWCGVCDVFKQRGLIVAQVEYRLGARHGATVGDALSDAAHAVHWMRSNAERLGVDPERIIIAGFSAGGHLAMSTASVPGIAESARPDLTIGYSACADLTDTAWAVRQAGGQQAAEAWSPVFHAANTHGPVLLLNHDRDHLCNIGAVHDFIETAQAAGADAELFNRSDAGHFSVYSDASLRADSATVVNAFLDRYGF